MEVIAVDNDTRINEMNITDEFHIVGMHEKGKILFKQTLGGEK